MDGRGHGMFSVGVILLISLTMNTMEADAQEFDREFTGVSFSPYTKPWEGESVPSFNSYNVHDLKVMLRLVATKFKHIATYSTGVTAETLSLPWDKGEASALVPRAASQINAEAGQTVLSVAQGIHQSTNWDIFQKEIQHAFEAAKEANSIHAGTVWGLIFTNQYITDDERGQEVVGLIRQAGSEAKSLGLKLGVRTNTCGDLLSNGSAKASLEELAKISDFIMCNVHPTKEGAAKGVTNAVDEIGDIFKGIKAALLKINPNLQVILGDSGWPSAGVSYNQSPNTIENLKDFWIAMNRWASTNKERIYIFEAFDEPWKSDIRNLDRSNPNGRYGAEGHFGWWKRLDSYNTRPNTYVEKINDEGELGRNSGKMLGASAMTLMLIGSLSFALYF